MFIPTTVFQVGLKRACTTLRTPGHLSFSTLSIRQSLIKTNPLKAIHVPKPATIARQPRPASSLKLLFASTGSFLLLSSFSLFAPSKIYNDTVFKENSIDVSNLPQSVGYKKSRFGGKLNYEELTIGSITGLFLGIIIGKLSSVFMFFTLSCYFMIEFLESRNIINIPWSYIITVGKEKVDVKELVLQKPSFKISFVLAFIIAAYNI